MSCMRTYVCSRKDTEMEVVKLEYKYTVLYSKTAITSSLYKELNRNNNTSVVSVYVMKKEEITADTSDFYI